MLEIHDSIEEDRAFELGAEQNPINLIVLLPLHRLHAINLRQQVYYVRPTRRNRRGRIVCQLVIPRMQSRIG